MILVNFYIISSDLSGVGIKNFNKLAKKEKNSFDGGLKLI